MRTRQAARLRTAALAAWFWLVIIFLFFPLIVVMVFSFNDSQIAVLPLRGFTTRWYASLLANKQILSALGNSLIVAAVTVVVSLLLGVSLAIGIDRHLRRTRKAVLAFTTAPMILPRLVLGVALLTFLNALDARLSLVTIALGHSLIGIPYVVLIVTARLQGTDRRLEEAAWDLGASHWMILRTVTLPLIAPAIVAGALIAFTLSFDDVVVAFFTTGVDNTLPMMIWAMLRFGITPELNALATVTLVFSAATAAIAEVTIRRSARPAKPAPKEEVFVTTAKPAPA